MSDKRIEDRLSTRDEVAEGAYLFSKVTKLPPEPDRHHAAEAAVAGAVAGIVALESETAAAKAGELAAVAVLAFRERLAQP